MNPIKSDVCLIACNYATAQDFSDFKKNLTLAGHSVQIFAVGNSHRKFQELDEEVDHSFFFTHLSKPCRQLLKVLIAKCAATAKITLVDVGSKKGIKILKALAKFTPESYKAAYLSHPKTTLFQSNSQIIEKILTYSQGLLFGIGKININFNRGPLPYTPDDIVELGYLPIMNILEVSAKRKLDMDYQREVFFDLHGMKDTQKKILAYFGGDKKESSSNGLQLFLKNLEDACSKKDLINWIIVFQQNPTSRFIQEELSLIASWNLNHSEAQIILSKASFQVLQYVATVAAYHTYEKAYELALAGIPTIQIGDSTQPPDRLVSDKMCHSIVDENDFSSFLENIDYLPSSDSDYNIKKIGYMHDWSSRLEGFTKKHL